MRPAFCMPRVEGDGARQVLPRRHHLGQEGLADRRVDRHAPRRGREAMTMTCQTSISVEPRRARRARRPAPRRRPASRAAASCGPRGRPTVRRTARARARAIWLGERGHAEQQGRAGQAVDQPGHGDLLDPVADDPRATGRRRTAGSCGGGTRAASGSSREPRDATAPTSADQAQLPQLLVHLLERGDMAGEALLLLRDDQRRRALDEARVGELGLRLRDLRLEPRRSLCRRSRSADMSTSILSIRR